MTELERVELWINLPSRSPVLTLQIVKWTMIIIP
jgi:hypothetical protein